MSAFNKLTIRTSNPALDLLKPHISHPYQLFHSPGDVEDTHPVQELSSGIPSKMESVLIINDIDDMNASFVLSEEGKRFCEDNKFQALSISFYGNKRMKTYADTSFTNQSSSTGFTSTRNVKAHIRQNENSTKVEKIAKMPINKLMKASTVVNSPLIQPNPARMSSSKGMESSRVQRKDIKGTTIDLNLKNVQRQEKSASQSRKGEKPEIKPRESTWRNREFGIVREGNSTSRTALKSNRSVLSPRQELKKSASGLINGLRSSQAQGRSGREANIPLGIIDLKGNCIREPSQGKSRPGSTLATNRAGKRDLSAELASANRAVTLYQKILENHKVNTGDSIPAGQNEKKPEENLKVSAVVVKNQDMNIKLSSYRAQTQGNVQMSERRKYLEENIKKKAQEKSMREVSSPQKTRHTTAKSVEKYVQKALAQNNKAQKKSVGNAQSLVKRPAGGKESMLSNSSSSYALFETEPNLRSSRLKKDPCNIDLSVSSPYMKSLKQSLVVESNKSKTNKNYKGMRLLGESERDSMLKLKKYFEGEEQDIGEILRSQRLDQI